MASYDGSSVEMWYWSRAINTISIGRHVPHKLQIVEQAVSLCGVDSTIRRKYSGESAAIIL